MEDYRKNIEKLSEDQKTFILNEIANIAIGNVYKGEKIDHHKKVELIKKELGYFTREDIFK